MYVLFEAIRVIHRGILWWTRKADGSNRGRGVALINLMRSVLDHSVFHFCSRETRSKRGLLFPPQSPGTLLPPTVVANVIFTYPDLAMPDRHHSLNSERPKPKLRTDL